MIKALEPYLKHIGNCGASDSCPIDERCICGLRQIFFREKVRYTKMQSITRYVQRVGTYGQTHAIGQENIERALILAKDL